MRYPFTTAFGCLTFWYFGSSGGRLSKQILVVYCFRKIYSSGRRGCKKEVVSDRNQESGIDPLRKRRRLGQNAGSRRMFGLKSLESHSENSGRFILYVQIEHG